MIKPITLQVPVLPNELMSRPLAEITDNLQLEAVRVAGSVLSQVTAKAVTVETAVFDGVELSSCGFKGATLTDVRLENCLLFGTNFDGSGWRRVEVCQGRHSGLVLTDCSLRDVAFVGAKLDLANFRASKLNKVIFQDCDLSGADFQSANLRDVQFVGCNLQKAEFSRAQLTVVDLRGSDIALVKGVNALGGAVITTAQLMSLAGAMAAEVGLIIED